MCKIDNSVYNKKMRNGKFWGEINESDYIRFKKTAKYMNNSIGSVLDIGCFCGEWLNYLKIIKPGLELTGIDIARDKIEDAKKNFPNINFKCGNAEDLGIINKTFDLVTCLEVLEHIPNWESTFYSLFQYAEKQIIITVPFKEEITETVCIHCGKMTPLYGHLHSFDVNCFPEVEGWKPSIHNIRVRNSHRSLLYNLYKLIKPNKGWLLIVYEKIID